MTIANKLKLHRQNSNFTQSEVAKALDIDRSTYSYYETGKTIPSLTTLGQIAKLFDINLYELLNDESSSEQLMSDDSVKYETNIGKNLPTALLSGEEKKLLLIFRQLDDTGRNEILKRAATLKEKRLEIDD